MSTEKKIIQIEVPIDEALVKLAKLRSEMDAIRVSQMGNKRSTEEQRKEWEKSQILMKQYGDQIRTVQKEVNNSIKQDKEKQGSLNQLKASLSQMTAQYNALSAAEREGAKGLKLGEAIKSTSDQLKAAEGSLGNFTRNVGDYEGALNRVMPQQLQFIQSIAESVKAAGGVVPAMSGAANAVKAFGLQLLKLLANPIVAILAAIAATVMLLVKAFNSNGAAVEKLQQIFAPFKAILNTVMNVLGSMVEWVLKGVEAYGKLLMAIADYIPGLDKLAAKSREAIALEREKQAIAEENRQEIVNDAKDLQQIADLKNKIAQKDKYTAEERLAFAREADRIAKAMMVDDVQRAERMFERLKRDMANEGKVYRTLTEEQKNEYRRLEAEVLNIRREYSESTKRLKANEAALVEEIEREQEAKRAAWQAAREKRRDEEIKKAENMLAISMAKQGEITEKGLADNWKKEKQIIDLKVKYQKITAEEATLARLQSEKKYKDGVLALAQEEVKNQVSKLKHLVLLEQLKEDEITAGAEMSATERYNRDLKRLNDAKTLAIAEAQTATDKEVKIAEIEQQYRTEATKLDAKLTADLSAADTARRATDAENAYELKRMSLMSDYQLELENLAAKEEAEKKSAEKTGADVLLIEKKYAKFKEILQREQLNAQLSAAAGFAGALSGLFKENSIAAKTAATAEAIINTYLGVTNAIAQTKGGIVAQILGAGTALLTGFAAVRKIWAVDVENPSPSGGGMSLSAPAPNMTSQIASPVTSSVQSVQTSGGAAAVVSGASNAQQVISSDSMTAAMVAAFASMPAPVVSVEEINRVENRVSVIETLSSY